MTSFTTASSVGDGNPASLCLFATPFKTLLTLPMAWPPEYLMANSATSSGATGRSAEAFLAASQRLKVRQPLLLFFECPQRACWLEGRRCAAALRVWRTRSRPCSFLAEGGCASVLKSAAANCVWGSERAWSTPTHMCDRNGSNAEVSVHALRGTR